jgi:hypothetical protein
MDCRLYMLLIQRYHDGDLDAVARAEYERHRRVCAACRELDERYGLVAEALGAMPVYEPSPGFNRRVLSRVDIAAYRTGPARRFFIAVERSWNAFPIPVRRCAVVAAVSALVIGVYKPLFDYVVRTVGQGAGGLWEGMRFMHGLLGKAAIVWKASGAARDYEVVWQTLFRALPRPAAGLHPVQTIALAAVMVAAAVVLIRAFGSARRKGETNVCLL